MVGYTLFIAWMVVQQASTDVTMDYNFDSSLDWIIKLERLAVVNLLFSFNMGYSMRFALLLLVFL